MTDETALFEGEVLIDAHGIYTFAHYYQEPQTKRQLIMVGMNHAADKPNYTHIKRILRHCDLVIFEGTADEDKSTDETMDIENLRALLETGSLENAFNVSFHLFFLTAGKVLDIVEESKEFRKHYSRPNWVSGDVNSRESQEEIQSEVMRVLAQIPDSRKKQIIQYVKGALDRAARGKFSKKDVADGFIFFWTDPYMVELILETLTHPRDRHCVEVFDREVATRNPSRVAITFGAAHMPYLRKFMEARGFVLQRSVRITNLSFE